MVISWEKLRCWSTNAPRGNGNQSLWIHRFAAPCRTTAGTMLPPVRWKRYVIRMASAIVSKKNAAIRSIQSRGSLKVPKVGIQNGMCHAAQSVPKAIVATSGDRVRFSR